MSVNSGGDHHQNPVNLYQDGVAYEQFKVVFECKPLSNPSANRLVTELATHNLYKVYIPATYLYNYAILRDVDVDFTNEEILDNIDGKNFKIVEIYRLNRKVNVENSSAKYVPSNSSNTIKLRIAGANGVCLNPNPKPIDPSPVITPDTPHPADHSYAQVANKFKLPTLHFSQSQSSDFNMDTAYDQNVHATSSLSTSAEVNAMNH
ncbi:hypothetical protein M8J75_010120 [Diaphorina citri]|nr:hypothetical protein M8J75_010120 [Diaphorina citri]